MDEITYRSVKGVVANLVESLEDERDRLAHEVERLTLHSNMQQRLIDKLAERRPERDGPSNCAQEGHLWVTQCRYCGQQATENSADTNRFEVPK